MKVRIYVINQDATVSEYPDFNSLVDNNEKEIRAYFAQKDEFRKKQVNDIKCQIDKLTCEKNSILLRIEALRKDLERMCK